MGCEINRHPPGRPGTFGLFAELLAVHDRGDRPADTDSTEYCWAYRATNLHAIVDVFARDHD